MKLLRSIGFLSSLVAAILLAPVIQASESASVVHLSDQERAHRISNFDEWVDRHGDYAKVLAPKPAQSGVLRGRTTATQEEMKKCFLMNAKEIKKHNDYYEKGLVHYSMKMSHYAGIHPDRICSVIGSRLPPSDDGMIAKTVEVPETAIGMLQTSKTVDWQKKGCVTPVKDQKTCSACYAFGGIAAFESHYCINNNKKLVSFSEQQILDCTFKRGNLGCNNGKLYTVFQHLGETGKVCTEKSYPYRGNADKNKCVEKKCSDIRKVRMKKPYYHKIPPKDVKSMMTAIQHYGPIACEFSAQKSFALYEGGVYTGDKNCSGSTSKRNHVLEFIGYGTDRKTGLNYWKFKNSWTTEWGLKGFGYMLRGENVCGCEMACKFPLFKNRKDHGSGGDSDDDSATDVPAGPDGDNDDDDDGSNGNKK